ncbi:DNA polymerase III subunit delta, partial [bacterium]|nr:DNA polymerase III subunit delta [bacterium]
KEMGAKVKHIVFKHPYENQISPWIKKEVYKYNKTIAEDACLYLKEEVGNNLIDLHNEIEKLIIYIGDRKGIIIEDVHSIVGHTRGNDIFQLLNNLGEKKGRETLEVMKNIVKTGEKPIVILVRIAALMRKLIKAKLFLEKGTTNEEIRGFLKIHNFYFRGFMEQVKNFSYRELKDNFRLLLLADKEIKTGKKEAILCLELLILKLTCQIPR